jgi:putative PEP-CTERM system integral membrane protein
MSDLISLPARPAHSRTDKWLYALFWSWNLIFVAFILLGFVPEILPFLVEAVQTELIPIKYLIYGIVLVLVPLVSILLGLTVFRRKPRQLVSYAYAIEGPLMLLLLIRFFIIREETPPVTLLSVVSMAGMAAFIWYLIDQNPTGRPLYIRCLKIIGLTLFLLITLYASIWVTFYALPLLVTVIKGIIQFLLDIVRQISNFWNGLIYFFRMGSQILLTLLGIPLLIFTGTLVVLMPVVVPILAVRAWLNEIRSFPSLTTRRLAGGISGAVVLVVAALMILASQQPQHRAFALLAEPPQTEAEARSLLKQQETIRKGLLNAYLAPVRYLSTVGSVDHIWWMYRDVFKITEHQALNVQKAYELVVRPLLYDPVAPVSYNTRWEDHPLQVEPMKAAELYQSFFDEPIRVGEKDSIVRAVRSTWDPVRANEAWQAVDDREIHLTTQEVHISEHGDWAEIELYEVYQNQTWQEQEVVYYFNLPETAVLTGLWLNDSPDRDNRFTFQVAPRGAAQAVYRSEVFRRVDPALLEQIGPRQYRLRIYPIAPLQWTWGSSGVKNVRKEGQPMHMWLTYRALAHEGEWPLPQMAELRNVYWDKTSQRQIAGKHFNGDAWLPPSLPASEPGLAEAHLYTFENGMTVAALPLDGVQIPELPAEIHLAVVLDRSRSMIRSENQITQALAQIADLQQGGALVDVYLTSSQYRDDTAAVVTVGSVIEQDILYFGGQNPSELLLQYNELSQGKPYDAVLVLTDASGYELTKSSETVQIPGAPFWMVHLNNTFPLGYDDDTLEAIQASGGGITGSLEEALTRIALALDGGASLSANLRLPTGIHTIDIVDGYAWVTFFSPQTSADTLAFESSSAFGAFAARRAILSEMQRNRGNLSELATLDALHQIAVEHQVVTPYSSMIVLVNDRQQKNLERLEGQADRFDREFEGAGETIPQSFSVTGVPEPEEWLLMALAAGLLIWYYRKPLRSRLLAQGSGRMEMR